MSLLPIVAGSAILLVAAYLVYGPILSRWLQLRADSVTPAVSQRDDIDFVPIEPRFLLSQHFSAIAAAGPIVGPILAGSLFGWLPALIWILVGGIFIGGVHDFTSLVASIRHKARSIAEVVRDHMSRRCYILFLSFVWLALVYIIVAFTDVTAGSFIGQQTLENGDIVTGGGVASSSLMYLMLPIVMGLLMRYANLSLNAATFIFLPLVGLSIWAGQKLPVSLEDVYGMSAVKTAVQATRPELEALLNPEQLTAAKTGQSAIDPLSLAKPAVQTRLKLTDDQKTAIKNTLGDLPARSAANLSSARKTWNVILLVYCVIASVLPMWLLLQPRGHLGGYFLYAALGVAGIGMLVSGLMGTAPIQYEMFRGWEVERGGKLVSMVPLLFITIACGACSGFHSIIASGTTSKQLRNEVDARVIGYGAMLLESMVAITSLACVMILPAASPLLTGDVQPNLIYANGLGTFGNTLGINKALMISFGLMAFTTFVYDTLDVCTRLGRYILQELSGWNSTAGQWTATILTAGVPMVFLIWSPTASGVPAWRIFWDLFGASNQLLAALTLLGVTVWLWQTYRAMWVLVAVGVPCVFMYIMSMWALVLMIRPLAEDLLARMNGGAGTAAIISNPVPWVAIVLAGLGGLMLLEAIRVLLANIRGSGPGTNTNPLIVGSNA